MKVTRGCARITFLRGYSAARTMARLIPDHEKTDAQLIADRIERLDLTLGTIEALLRRMLEADRRQYE